MRFLKRIYCCLICLLGFWNIVLAQQPLERPKRTLTQIRAMKVDSNKVIAYYDYLDHDQVIWSTQPKIVLQAGVEMQEIATQLAYQKGITLANLILSRYDVMVNDYVKAVEHAGKSVVSAKKYGQKRLLANTLATTSSIYGNIEEYDQALVYLQQALPLFKELKDSSSTFYALSRIAQMYQFKKNTDQMLAYDKQIMEFATTEDLKVYGYCQLAWHLYLAKDYLAAYHNSQLYFKLKDKYPAYYSATLNTLGAIYRDAPDSLLLKMGVKPSQRLQKMAENFGAALKIAQAQNDYFVTGETLKDISEVYALQGNYKGAFEAYKKHIVVRDSASVKDKQAQVMQYQFRETYNKKADSLKFQQQLSTVKVKQERNYFIGGLIILLLITFFVFRNSFTQRKLNKVITKEKQRSDELLMNILPADVAEELKQKGSANARQFEEVTVLFTDFVNFTTVSEQLSPQALVDELNDCFVAFDQIMIKHDIEKIKTIGDAYLAVAGLPNADIKHASQVITAALEIKKFMTDRKKTKGDQTFEIRIGIHSGSVVAGIVGIKKFAYDIWGDTVNTAARMEQNAEPGKINVSETTYQLSKNQFEFTYRGEIEAKNKGALKMYFVEG